MSTLKRAIEIAYHAHKNQTDKSGNPYILHPLRVMGAMMRETEKIVAVLHDVLEDSGWSVEHLRNEGFTEEVIEALRYLTFFYSTVSNDATQEKLYFEYIQNLAHNPIARIVKRADLLDNMDISRLKEFTPKDYRRFEKYRRALALLDYEVEQRYRRERARLHFVGMDLVYTCGGYAGVHIRSGAGDVYECARANIRQTVDALANSLYGPDWVEVMIEHGKGQKYEDMRAEEHPCDPWVGPRKAQKNEDDDNATDD